MNFSRKHLGASVATGAILASNALAGVVNPDISLIGQVLPGWTDDASSIDANHPTLSLGETELAADAALNPFASGTFVLSFGDEGVEVEEAYVKLEQALPWGLGLKAGRYRAPFGKLNPSHPHAYPFVGAPHMLESTSGLIPGEESYDETALQISELFPGIGSWAPSLSLDIQQGSGFRTSQADDPDAAEYDSLHDQTAPSFLAHFGNFFEVGDDLVGDFGLSFAQGTTSVEKDEKATLAGADLKLKYAFDPQSRIMWQSEAIWRHDDRDDGKRLGAVTFADWTIERWNVGALYEQLADLGAGEVVDRSVRAFGGFSLMEETTMFRIALERRWIGDQEPIHTVSGQILFSMGPHKPHQF